MIVWMILGTIAALCLVLVPLYLFFLLRPGVGNALPAPLLCDYAHRGLHGDGIPENSLAAFSRACEAGVGIELDVRLSADGCVMVFHDETLARMTGWQEKVSALDADTLTSLSLMDTEEHIPTFEAVLSLVGGRVPLLVELKGESLDTALCPQVAELLRAYKGPYCMESFNPLLLREMKKHLPGAVVGLLYTNAVRDKKKVSAVNLAVTGMVLNFLCAPQFLACNRLDREARPVTLLRRLYRIPCFIWTVRNTEERDAAHTRGEQVIYETKEST